jgi:class 3 adenylate cyclase/predicted ATPase
LSFSEDAVDIAAWLSGLGLERYVEAFEANDIEASVLRTLNADDLRELGVTSIGHRKKLLEAIAALREPAGAPTARSAEPGMLETPRDAERRQLTVLFCDLVGSTELSARLDPEDMGDVIRTYQICCAEVVSRWEGHIAKYMGDGVLAYFGYPRAHEDDAERAVRAGLKLADAIAGLRPRADVRLQARIGIATGQVVVGDLVGRGAAERDAVFGATPNLAARLQQAVAGPGDVVMAQSTRHLVSVLFELADLGKYELKGFAEPIQAWRVQRESGATSRFEARTATGLTPLVGREHELALLVDRWAQAKNGEGRVMLLSGEPGIGKSRIVETLRERLSDEPHAYLDYQCSPFHTNSALHPVTEQLARAAGFARNDTAADKLDKLEAVLSKGTDRGSQAVALLASAMAIPTGERYPPLEVTRQQQKQRTLKVLVEQLQDLAATQPVLMVLEDAHWIDPTTRELFDLVLEQVGVLPALVILTVRPGFRPASVGSAQISALTINRLGPDQCKAMVERIAGSRDLPAEVRDLIVAKTDGVPLFIEELTRAVLESELPNFRPDSVIPTTLHDALVARLDRAAPAKEVAQIGAVIGREFTYDLLAEVARSTNAKLAHALEWLTRTEVVIARGTPPEASYVFKHALVQETAYQTLTRRKRKQLHACLAQVLAERSIKRFETAPEVVAHHYAEAGLAQRAIEYWIRAGDRAIARWANVEAIGHLTKGLTLLKDVPQSDERDRLEIQLQIALGGAFGAHENAAAPATKAAYDRVIELRRQDVEIKHLQLIRALYGQFVATTCRAEFATARDIADELLRTSEQNDRRALFVGQQAIGFVLFERGQLRSALSYIEQALEPENRAQGRDYAGFSNYPSISLTYLSWTLFILGYPDQALSRANEALAEAERASPLTYAVALGNDCYIREFVGDRHKIAKSADQLISLATEKGMPRRMEGSFFSGLLRADQGDFDDGIDMMHRAFDVLHRWGDEEEAPYKLALIGKAYRNAGKIQQSLSCITEALAQVNRTGEGWYEAELHRIKGSLLLSLPKPDEGEAEASFWKAIETARAQEAKSWELRAATSIARLWRHQGRRSDARDLLAPVYAWFTEGFDTADLKDAKALLAQLA